MKTIKKDRQIENVEKEQPEIETETEQSAVEAEKQKTVKKKKERELVSFNEGKLLVTFVNRGFSEDVIHSANQAGATGATILNGRGLGRIPEKFLGMSVMPGREIVMILVSAELADAVMTAIAEKNGVRSPAGGVCFCLPVSHMTKLKH